MAKKLSFAGRWHVVIFYHNPKYAPDVFDVEELEEIQDIVERGRDWNEIERIEVHLIRRV